MNARGLDVVNAKVLQQVINKNTSSNTQNAVCSQKKGLRDEKDFVNVKHNTENIQVCFGLQSPVPLILNLLGNAQSVQIRPKSKNW